MAVEGFDEVLAAARTGQEWAIAMLYRDLQPRLLRYLRSQERGVAEDLASETWLQAVRSLPRFSGDETAFTAWMFTIARNRLSDWRRAAARRPAVVTAPDDLSERGSTPDAETLALGRLDVEAAMALISTLPAEQVEVVLLRVLGGLDTERVAQIVGKRPGAVRVLQHRALRRLAQQLAVAEAPAAQHGVTR